MLPFFRVSNIKPDLNDTFLNSLELEEFSKLKFVKRKVEWLNSRYLAKLLISEIFNCDLKEIYIYNDKDRKPFACVKERNFRISISHREDLCGCALNRDFSPHIGLDIEKIEEKDKSWEEFFSEDFDEEEKKDNCKMIELWALKEAILKMLGLGLSVDLREIKLKNGKIIFSNRLVQKYGKSFAEQIKYKIFKQKDYVIALTWRQDG